MIHCESGHRPMLFDLESDPQELTDPGASPDHAGVIEALRDRLDGCARRPVARTTMPTARWLAKCKGGSGRKGVMIGVVEPCDVAPELTARYIGRKAGHRHQKIPR